MKLKTLLLLCFVASNLFAQEPYRSLLITEARYTDIGNSYVEITNMGDIDINLGEFEFGQLRANGFDPIVDVNNDNWSPFPIWCSMLPNVILKPGESWVVARAYDFGPEMYKRQIPGFEGGERPNQLGLYQAADFLLHAPEQRSSEFPFVKDSVTLMEKDGVTPLSNLLETRRSSCFYLEHHFAEGDSAVVDQVGGVFDDNGRNIDQFEYDVAGVSGATGNSILVRKFSIKKGNLDFANARGIGLNDSEWMPVTMPDEYNSWREMWWTLGNHGDYILDEKTLESDVVDIDFVNKKLTVPWGTRRLDDIMKYMKKKPGIAWNYELNGISQDSIYRSAQNGDKLTIYVLGSTFQTATLDIIVKEPAANANNVVPKAHIDYFSIREGGPTVTNTQAGILSWPRVTKNETGNDTITGSWFGLPSALRTDSLLKYLEKPMNASWEFEWVDGVERADLKNGDKLKIIAENGEEKVYYLQVQPYRPSSNAFLSSITWPDIPDFYKGIFGWTGDTIPGFSPRNNNYQITIPHESKVFPSLIAKSEDLHAKINVTRATTFSGTIEDRTVTYEVIAEDDSVKNTYQVEMSKEKLPENIQPYHAEPFISEVVWRELFRNSHAEICNPGTEPLDLSNYMIVSIANANPAEGIKSMMLFNNWPLRYRKYVPGYKWVNEIDWQVQPGILKFDLAVNPIVQPGDVFCLGAIDNDIQLQQIAGEYQWQLPLELDVQFYNKRAGYKGDGEYLNPWGEEVAWVGDPVNQWKNVSLFLFKILNDSIKRGLKPANDPYDFELIDAFGMADGSVWQIGGFAVPQVSSMRRKSEIYKGNPVLGESMGTTSDNSEWTLIDPTYYNKQGFAWPLNYINVGSNIGQHYFVTPTHYMSTIKSIVYKVSEGYSLNEQIRGIRTGTAVSDFLSNIIKANENQSLKVTSVIDGTELAIDALLSINDTLTVLSADSTNTSKYVIEVTEKGLISNAILTSERYLITVDDETKSKNDQLSIDSGSITGFEYGTTLKTVLNNIIIPVGANLSILNGAGAYIPLKNLNFDTTYVQITVNTNTYFEVIAEDGITSITYQLQPETSESSAFVTSDFYVVEQSNSLIKFVPRNTTVWSLLNNVVASGGATLKLVDKNGLERMEGAIYQDDKLVVTSQNGLSQKVYYLSMLNTELVPTITYLAYITSNVYSVDQLGYEIVGATTSTLVTEFYARIKPSEGATAVVIDKDGNEKISLDLDDGDKLKVTSKDGKVVVIYKLVINITNARITEGSSIDVYPNPTTGKLNIRSVNFDSRLQLFSSTGEVVYHIRTQDTITTIDINHLPSGVYLLVVIDNNNLLSGNFKIIKK